MVKRQRSSFKGKLGALKQVAGILVTPVSSAVPSGVREAHMARQEGGFSPLWSGVSAPSQGGCLVLVGHGR